ncbi:ABC transporter permease [Halocatena marina]|uniref:ABC transporter permease n=1 Tax=Halocatena marina TaxID=2934937 RepID=UPI00200C8D05|nr:ABC transporter permease subunit [Halocatena marina]
MNWRPVARKEFRDLVRSKGAWLMGLLITAGAIYLMGDEPPFVQNQLGTNVVLAAFQRPVGVIVPLTAILIAYRSIAGERVSGSIKFAVGFPQTRSDILIGKILGQSVALGVPLIAAFLVAGATGIVRIGLFSLIGFASFLGLSLLYTLVNVSIATGISAAVSRPTRAAAGTFGYFLVFLLSWYRIRNWMYSLVTGETLNIFTPPASEWLFLFERLSPITAFYLITNRVLGVGNGASGYFNVLGQFQASITTNALVYDLVFTDPAPFYLTEEFGLVILGLWIIIPSALGFHVFRTADLS